MFARSNLYTIVLTSICLVAIACQSKSACADIVTFTHSGISASGSLGGTAFANKDFTITAVGDTDNRTSPGTSQFLILHDSATITIQDVGTFSFITQTQTFFDDILDSVGFSKPPVNGGELYRIVNDPVLDGWDMLTSIGPISVPHQVVGWDFIVVNTTGGVLIFDDATINGTFQAVVFVPEPTSFGLLGLGAIVGLLLPSSRRRRQVV